MVATALSLWSINRLLVFSEGGVCPEPERLPVFIAESQPPVEEKTVFSHVFFEFEALRPALFVSFERFSNEGSEISSITETSDKFVPQLSQKLEALSAIAEHFGHFFICVISFVFYGQFTILISLCKYP